MTAKFDFSAVDSPYRCRWPVSVNWPLDGGKVEIRKFDAILQLMTDEDLEAATKDVEQNKTDPDRALVKRYLVGLPDHPDQPELTEAFLKKFLAPPVIVLGLKAAYQEFAGGVAAKN
ncbi:hypothetical protein [Caulobacter segnis]|uniref:Uncharacterized protein n=1 Tax=Caulobacter segnis TaxID=88688 RepID=A0A2W5WW95_9CAUL|nr:hypothetical protein [Caulobacter segnis]PZR32294.1 MAG: hypothetical protein DI526_17115 [Caulobacter segnis]